MTILLCQYDRHQGAQRKIQHRWQSQKDCVAMNNSLIFDVGCHTGEDSDFYLKKGFTVVAVEANPALCEEVRRRFSDPIANGRFILVDKAIAEHDGEIDFYINLQANIWGTIRPAWAERNAAVGANSKKVTVPSVKFASLVQQYGVPYYLKIDIEGADLLCLEGLLPFGERPPFVSIEIEHRSLLRDEMGLFGRLGYKKFQIVEQGFVDKQIPPNPAKEGIYADYQFRHGASGLFGKELPNVWLNRAGFMKQYYTLLARNRLIGLAKRLPALKTTVASRFPVSWYDMHAALN
jgi:FkbM family methyltransferase